MTRSEDALRPFRLTLACSRSVVVLAIVGALACGTPAKAQANIVNSGGPIMQTSNVYLVFWLPPNNTFDSSVANGIGNYETLLTSFFEDVSPSTYFSVVGQYSGTCSSNTCLVQNSSGSVRVGGTFVDTRAYAHADGTAAAGTNADPLLDADIQHEVQSLITQFGLSDGSNSEFFVYLGSGIQECMGAPASGAECTFFNPLNVAHQAFCAYHSDFTDSNGGSAVYAVMPMQTVWEAGAMKAW